MYMYNCTLSASPPNAAGKGVMHLARSCAIRQIAKELSLTSVEKMLAGVGRITQVF